MNEELILQIWNLLTTLGILPALLFWLYIRERQEKLQYLELYHRTLERLAETRLQTLELWQEWQATSRDAQRGGTLSRVGSRSEPSHSP